MHQLRFTYCLAALGCGFGKTLLSKQVKMKSHYRLFILLGRIPTPSIPRVFRENRGHTDWWPSERRSSRADWRGAATTLVLYYLKTKAPTFSSSLSI